MHVCDAAQLYTVRCSMGMSGMCIDLAPPSARYIIVHIKLNVHASLQFLSYILTSSYIQKLAYHVCLR
jgi:hypothetical protein